MKEISPFVVGRMLNWTGINISSMEFRMIRSNLFKYKINILNFVEIHIQFFIIYTAYGQHANEYDTHSLCNSNN